MLGTFLCYFTKSIFKLSPRKDKLLIGVVALLLCLETYRIESFISYPALNPEIEFVCLVFEAKLLIVEAVYLSWMLLLVSTLVSKVP